MGFTRPICSHNKLVLHSIKPQKGTSGLSACYGDARVGRRKHSIRHINIVFIVTLRYGFSILIGHGKGCYENNIYVTDFFFTTCPSICPIMTKNMAALQESLSEYSQVKLLSFSVTPAIDSVAQLKRYAIKNNIDDSRWNLVTGDKKEIYALARKSYLVVKDDGDGGPYDMIHTENFVLVDAQKRIRGYYDGTQATAMDTLLEDIKILVAEN